MFSFCYLSINGFLKINSLETYNAILSDLNSEQQNITFILGRNKLSFTGWKQTYVKILIGDKCFVKK
jgi:hypothetical protein